MHRYLITRKLALLIALPLVAVAAVAAADNPANAVWETPQVKVGFTVFTDWNDGLQAEVTITNKTSEPLGDWRVSFRLDRNIQSIWNATAESKPGGFREFNADGFDWNRRIPANGTVRFGFLAMPGRLLAPPTDFSVRFGGSPTTPPAVPNVTAPQPSSTPAPPAPKSTPPVNVAPSPTPTVQAPASTATPASVTPSPVAQPSAQQPAVEVICAVPFGSRPDEPSAGTLRPGWSAEQMDALIVEFYEKWKRKFLVRVGGAGWMAIRSNDASHPFVAEGQGYGLEILVRMAGADPQAKKLFDAVLKYVVDHPSKIDSRLMAAEQNEAGVSVNGRDSATDGDLSIAYALLLADRQWGSGSGVDYRALALERIRGIKQSAFDRETHLPLLGDWVVPGTKYSHSTRPSDFMFTHFRAFRRATGDRFWDRVRAATGELIDRLQKEHAPKTGLIPDFVVATNTRQPRPAPPDFLEAPTDGDFYYNAIRVPWRLAADAALYGSARNAARAQKMNDWVRKATGNDPARIRAGYRLKGEPLTDRSDAVFRSMFATAALRSEGWLDTLWTNLAETARAEPMPGYYGSSLLLQAMLLISGNDWTPTASAAE